MNIADKLRKVLEIKNNIKAALEEKGIENVGNDFSNYAESIANIKGGGDEPEPEEKRWEKYDYLPDLNTILNENKRDDYPYRVIQLIPASDKDTELFIDDNSTHCLIVTSDGTSYSVSDTSKILHSWNDDRSGYRWVLHNFQIPEFKFSNVFENCIWLINDGGSVDFFVTKAAFRDKKILLAIETINNGEILFSRGNKIYQNVGYAFNNDNSLEFISGFRSVKAASFYRMFYNCYNLRYIDYLDTYNYGNPSGSYSSTEFEQMFYYCRSLETLPKGVVFDHAYNLKQMFYGCYSLKKLPKLSLEKCLYTSYCFNDCKSLSSLDIKLTSNFKDGNMGLNLMDLDKLLDLTVEGLDQENVINGNYFVGLNAKNLVNINIVGGINRNLAFNQSPYITHQSLLNIINALVPQEEGVTKTLSLGSTNIAKLSEEEIAIATSKGWTVS